MEAIGLVLGVAGIFTVCTEALERFDAYRDYGITSSQLSARFGVEKLRLQEWADAVGIDKNNTLREKHHYRLDESTVQTFVIEILGAIGKLLKTADSVSKKVGNYKSDTPDARNLLPHLKSISNPSTKIKFALGREARFTRFIETLEALVDKLHLLVPPRSENSFGDWGIATIADRTREEHLSSFLDISKEFRSLFEDSRKKDRIGNLKLIDDILNTPKIPDQLEAYLDAKIDGTCDWILQSPMYQTWLTGDTDSTSTAARFLWLYGPPGYGKTILCSNIIHSLNETHKSFVFHFFSGPHAQSNGEPEDIVRFWISQIARVNDSTLDMVYTQFGIKISSLTLSSMDLWRIFASIVLQLGRQCIFIIDGFDEYSSLATAGEVFFRNFKQSLEHTSSAVLIVSRDEQEIRAQLVDDTHTNDGIELYNYSITKEDNFADVNLYSQHIVKKKLDKKSTDLQQNITTQLAERSDGMFTWVKLSGNELRNRHTKPQLEKFLIDVPKGLFEIYERNWQRILNQSDDDKERGLKILQWCAFAVRPLTVVELTEALIVDVDDEYHSLDLTEFQDMIDLRYIDTDIKSPCASLVDIKGIEPASSPKDMTVQLVHVSIKQYLLSKQSTTGTDPVQHAELAKICLRYLCYTTVSLNTETEERDENLGEFRQYALENWTIHHKKSPQDDEVLQNLIVKFLCSDSHNFAIWAHAFEKQEFEELPLADDLNSERPPAQPMYYAALLGSVPVMESLHEIKGDTVNTVGGYLGTALQAACMKGYPAVIQKLIDWGTDVNINAGYFGSSLLAATYKANYVVASQLLENGADIHARNSRKSTPLHNAATSGSLELVRLLLLRGKAEIDAVNEFGSSPLYRAAIEGHIEIVRFLADHGCKIDVPDIDEETALNGAVLAGHLNAVEFLISRGAKVNATSIYDAASKGHTQILAFLLNQSTAGINTRNKQGFTPIFSAATLGHLEAVHLLLERGAHIEFKDLKLDPDVTYTYPHPATRTPLNGAAESGHLKIIQELLKKGADVESSNPVGATPMMFAALTGRLDTVNLLAEFGADINASEVISGITSMMYAIHSSHSEILQALLNLGATTDKADVTGATALHYAALNGNVEMVRMLLHRDLDLEVTNASGQTPLHLAALSRHLEVVKLLIEKGAMINARQDKNITALQSASAKGHVEIVKLLLDQNADPEVAATGGQRPLHAAAIEGHPQVVQMLLEKGVNTDVREDNKLTALHCAAARGHTDIVRLLVDQGGADVNALDVKDQTPLHNGACQSKLETVEFLLERNADITAVDNDQATALHFATVQGHLELIHLLLERGLSIHAVTSCGYTVLHLAAVHGRLEVARFFTGLGVDIHAVDSDGFMPLHLAAARGHLEVARLFIDLGADIHAVSLDGQTPLLCAANSGHLEVVQYLLDLKSDIETVEMNGLTLLSCACIEGHLEVVQFLLERGSDIEARSRSGATPLFNAARNGRVSVVQLLLDKGSDIEAANNDGWRPLSIAVGLGLLDIVQVLLDRGADIEATKIHNMTPLAVAANDGQAEMASFLLDRGANIASLDIDGATPLWRATSIKEYEVVRVLMDRGSDPLIAALDGRTALDIATAEGDAELIKLLSRNVESVVVDDAVVV